MSEYFNPAIGRWVAQREGGSWDYRYRLVMEQHIGRRLRSDEHVHHRNRDHTDDRLGNLQILTPSEHAVLHAGDRIAGRKAKWLHDWSPRYAACIECSTIEREHVAKGLCDRCYFRLRKRITGGHKPRASTTVTATCPTCRVEFSRTLTQGRATYCSQSCASRASNARRVYKITAEQAAAIRNSTARGVDLARRYGISTQHVCNIRKGRVRPEAQTEINRQKAEATA